MTDTYVVSDSGKATIIKDPDAVLDYSFDWSEWLDDVSDSIDTHTVTVESGITLDSSSLAGQKVIAWLSGGTAGTTYRVTCHIVTDGGREDDRSIFVKVKER